MDETSRYVDFSCLVLCFQHQAFMAADNFLLSVILRLSSTSASSKRGSQSLSTRGVEFESDEV